MDVDEANRRAVAALEKAQALSGARSATAFARLLADRADGTPTTSTYRRWIAGEASVPAWVLTIAAEVVGATAADLLTEDAADLATWREGVDDALARLNAEVADIREALSQED